MKVLSFLHVDFHLIGLSMSAAYTPVFTLMVYRLSLFFELWRVFPQLSQFSPFIKKNYLLLFSLIYSLLN